MASSHTSSKKRQRELARIEKQREKAAKRMQRKAADKHSPEEVLADPNSEGLDSSEAEETFTLPDGTQILVKAARPFRNA